MGASGKTKRESLYKVHEVPTHFRELFILGAYRYPKSTFEDCVWSIFEANNEMLNFWTHIIPAFCLICWVSHMFVYDLYENFSSYELPFAVYSFSMCVYPIASAFAHVFNTMSDHARHVCFFVDYAALSFYALGSAIAYRAYSFPLSWEHTVFETYYVHMAAFNAIISMSMCCATRIMEHGVLKKVFRISSMAVPYLFDVIPVVYRYLFPGEGDLSDGIYPHMRQFMFVFLSAFFYLSHLPEKLAPGRFDVFLHSHQLFHIMSILGTRDQLQAFFLDLKDRQHLLSEPGHADLMPSFQGTAGIMTAIGVINVIQLLIFSSQLHRIIPQEDSIMAQFETNNDHKTIHEINGNQKNLSEMIGNKDRCSLTKINCKVYGHQSHTPFENGNHQNTLKVIPTDDENVLKVLSARMHEKVE